MIEFPISGVETYWWLPIVVAFVISVITSTAGISGAFLILPFQISFLGFVSPAVTPTNLLFNVIAIPSGVYRFYRERRMVWPLVWVVSMGTIPGLIVGVLIRVRYLPDPAAFRLFVGCVLLYIAARLVHDVVKNVEAAGRSNQGRGNFQVATLQYNLRAISYVFENSHFTVSTPALFFLSALIGAVGGVYGIGGGSILAPFLVTVFSLPIHTVAGAVLCGTFLSSVFGVLFYILLSPLFGWGGAVSPDWHLGLMFGLGGMMGVYVGARIQKFLPARSIKLILGAIMLIISGKYILGFFS